MVRARGTRAAPLHSGLSLLCPQPDGSFLPCQLGFSGDGKPVLRPLAASVIFSRCDCCHHSCRVEPLLRYRMLPAFDLVFVSLVQFYMKELEEPFEPRSTEELGLFTSSCGPEP